MLHEEMRRKVVKLDQQKYYISDLRGQVNRINKITHIGTMKKWLNDNARLFLRRKEALVKIIEVEIAEQVKEYENTNHPN